MIRHKWQGVRREKVPQPFNIIACAALIVSKPGKMNFLFGKADSRSKEKAIPGKAPCGRTQGDIKSSKFCPFFIAVEPAFPGNSRKEPIPHAQDIDIRIRNALNIGGFHDTDTFFMTRRQRNSRANEGLLPIRKDVPQSDGEVLAADSFKKGFETVKKGPDEVFGLSHDLHFRKGHFSLLMEPAKGPHKVPFREPFVKIIPPLRTGLWRLERFKRGFRSETPERWEMRSKRNPGVSI